MKYPKERLFILFLCVKFGLLVSIRKKIQVNTHFYYIGKVK